MLKNAERHRDNPEFQRDMLATVEHVVGRMNELMLQLRTGATPVAKPRRSGSRAASCERVCDAKRGRPRGRSRDRSSRRGSSATRIAWSTSSATWSRTRWTPPPEAAVDGALRREDGPRSSKSTDRGIGMSPEFVRERLFKPFETTKPAGMGIGVYESSQYVASLGGRIEDRQRAGRRHARAALAAAAPRSRAALPAPPHRARMTEARKPLLIVEDDPALQKQMRWAFDNYETVVANDRESAIAQLRRYEPAVVTMDLGLPPAPDDPTEGLQAARGDSRARAGHQGHRPDRAERPGQCAAGHRARRPRLLHQAVRAGASWPGRSTARSASTSCRRRTGACRRAQQAPAMSGIITRDPAMQRICRTIEKVAPTGATVLILGESGTGKELFARALHDLSPRATQPLRGDQLRGDPRERCSRASCSATRRAPSPAPSSRRSARSRRPTAARCSSTRSATCRCRCRRSCCASCRSA